MYAKQIARSKKAKAEKAETKPEDGPLEFLDYCLMLIAGLVVLVALLTRIAMLWMSFP